MMTCNIVTAQRNQRIAGMVTMLAAASFATTGCAHGNVAAAEAQPAAVQVAAEKPAGPAAAAPGTDPAIQKWFKKNEKARVKFNNDLLKAEQDIAKASGTKNCSALSKSTSAIQADLVKLRAIANGGPAIADAYTPPFEEFAAAATACVAKDYPHARTILGDTSKGAIADMGGAQETVDEILDGGA
jgi:hypothetical protein